MEMNRDELLPGSHTCVGCGGLTFRRREDSLCPRCAFEAESLIERIELDGLAHDLQLITEFEAYYRQREQRKRFQRIAAGPVFPKRSVLDPIGRADASFAPDPFWQELRKAG